MKLFIKIFNKYQKFKNPIKYWRNKGAIIGENCEIYSSANFGSEPFLITIGNHVRINEKVELITHDGGVWVLREKFNIINSEDIDLFGAITIGNNVHIGTNAMIMPGVKIGNNCIIGCSSVVTRDIPDNSIVIGVPGRVIGTIDEYYEKHKMKFDYTKRMDKDKKKIYLLKKYKK